LLAFNPRSSLPHTLLTPTGPHSSVLSQIETLEMLTTPSQGATLAPS